MKMGASENLDRRLREERDRIEEKRRATKDEMEQEMWRRMDFNEKDKLHAEQRGVDEDIEGGIATMQV